MHKNLHLDSSDKDTRVANSVVNPYENEPLANAAEENFLYVHDDADA